MTDHDSSNIQPELISLKTKLAAEIDNDKKEIEFRQKRIAKNEALLAAVKSSLGVIERPDSKPAAATEVYGAKSESIRAAINGIRSNQFTILDVEKSMLEIDPEVEINRPRLRTALWSMADKEQIRLVTKGTNSTPAVYEKIDGVVRYQRRTQEDAQQALEMHSNKK